MIEDHTKMLIATIQKLHSRGARHNIQRILAKSHKADVAAILHGLRPDERFSIFMMEPSQEKRADVMSYLDEEVQLDILGRLDKDEVLKLVVLMESDDAADLLGNLPEEESKEILASMVTEDSQEVADLMGYPEDSAGGLMSSDFLALDKDKTVGDAIQAIQEDEESLGSVFYIYVINDHRQLVGVASLKQLLLSKRTTALKHIMRPEVISVPLDTDQEEVAKTVERYDFLSVPVVDANNQLEGVITVDDVIDVIREEAEEDLLAMGQAGWGLDGTIWDHFKARSLWLLLAFFGGSLCFSIVFFFGYIGEAATRRVDELWLVAAFIPLILSLGATTGSQAATVAVGAIRAGRFDIGKTGAHIRQEVILSILFALVFGVLVVLFGELIFGSYGLSWVMGGAVFIQIVLAMAIGNFLPIAMHRSGMDPTVGSVPLFTVIADLSAVAILFGLLRAAG